MNAIPNFQVVLLYIILSFFKIIHLMLCSKRLYSPICYGILFLSYLIVIFYTHKKDVTQLNNSFATSPISHTPVPRTMLFNLVNL